MKRAFLQQAKYGEKLFATFWPHFSCHAGCPEFNSLLTWEQFVPLMRIVSMDPVVAFAHG